MKVLPDSFPTLAILHGVNKKFKKPWRVCFFSDFTIKTFNVHSTSSWKMHLLACDGFVLIIALDNLLGDVYFILSQLQRCYKIINIFFRVCPWYIPMYIYDLIIFIIYYVNELLRKQM